MITQALVVAHKEIVDGLRDVRALLSALAYGLMGPVVVLLVSLAIGSAAKPEAAKVLTGMMAVFTLVSAFVGGMSVAMDTVAGERERRSLLPLLLNPILRADLVLGKWLAVSLFAVAGLAVNLLGFAIVLPVAGVHYSGSWGWLAAALLMGIVPLALLAAALQILTSTLSRNVKEAQTYLSMLVFVPMLAGMFVVFFAGADQAWSRVFPVVGQQLQLELLLEGSGISLMQPALLGCSTLAPAILLLLLASKWFERDEIIYGN